MDWKSTLATVAPAIASAIGSPVAGVAVSAGLKLLGIEPEPGNEEAQLEAAVKRADPETLLKLKQADHEFREAMRKLDIDLDRIAAEDRASARDLAKARGMLPQVILSVVYTVAYALVLWAYITGRVQVPEAAQAQFSIVLGVLTAAQAQILNFWFGSSSGSKEKTAHLAHKMS